MTSEEHDQVVFELRRAIKDLGIAESLAIIHQMAEERMDIIGQNGNNAEHYNEVNNNG